MLTQIARGFASATHLVYGNMTHLSELLCWVLGAGC